MLLLTGLALAGCAGVGSGVNSSDPTDPPLSSTTPPTILPPTAPPKDPTDVQGASRRTGTVTVGGNGPCYGFVTDDGAELALYSEAGVTLTEGQTLTVQVSPAAFTADCGPGILMRLLSVDAG